MTEKSEKAKNAPYTRHMRCIVCGKAFDIPSSNKRRTCSDECEYQARSRASKGRISPNRIDITGRTYGELTAIRRINKSVWLFQCSCGRMIERQSREVVHGKTVSCGHIRDEIALRHFEQNTFRFYDGTSISAIKGIMSGKRRKTNTSGVTGVRITPRKCGLAYQALICVQGRRISLGTYDTLEAAAAARKAAEIKYFAPIIKKYEDEKYESTCGSEKSE